MTQKILCVFEVFWKTHNLTEIYEKLAPEDQTLIKSEYDSVRELFEKDISENVKKEGKDIPLGSLDDALRINADIVTNYKYTMDSNKVNAAHNNTIKTKGTIYTVPYSIGGSFLSNLLKEIKKNYNKSPISN